MAELRRDPLGIPYDSAWTDDDGAVHYSRSHAAGGPYGGASWSSDYDCNPVCGCHLSARCRGCGVCTTCDGCYCQEDEF